MKRLPPVDVKHEYTPFFGGLDVVTPPLHIPRGYVRFSQNRECAINGGYARVAGYERYDGRVRPSDAQYAIISITLTGSLSVGNAIVGGTSAATAQIIAIESTYIAVTKLVGTFVNGEAIKVGGVTQATATSDSAVGAGITLKIHAQYNNLAADVYRADIGKVPGSGSVRGVHVYNDIRYAWRDNAGGTACVMHKATGSGWSAVTLYNEISFTAGGTATPVDGQVLTQGGVTATIKRVVLQSGAWAGTAVGRFIIVNPTGGNFAAGAATVSVSGATITLSGVQTAISFAVPGGRFELFNSNMTGSSGTVRMYGADGKNRGFEFDGDVLVPIATGVTVDTPLHVIVHKQQLFFSFAGSNLHSGPQTPYQWTALAGASEIACGADIVGYQIQPGSTTGGALAIFTTNAIHMLYGNTSADWVRVEYKTESGALPYTIQRMIQTFFLNGRGISTMVTAQEFGNFSDLTITKKVQTWLSEKRSSTVGSMIVREKNQYRLFFSDGSALYVTMDNKKVIGMMPILLTHIPSCLCSAELSDKTEVCYFGGTDGYVYEMERGTSFDGDAIDEYIYLAWDALGSPRILKTFFGCAAEMSGGGYAEFNFSYELGYASTDIEQKTPESFVTGFSSARWDEFTWDSFIWDGQTLLPAEMDMRGDAENVSLIFSSSSDYFEGTTISGATIAYCMRRAKR